jgi:large subunit ribosomal protein L15
MQLHQIKAKAKKKGKKRIGRGGKRGAYSGKGMKGQKSRAGRKIRPQWRDIIKKLPKKRGYHFASRKRKPTVLNLDVLEKKFKENEKVTPKILFEKGIIKKTKGMLPEVKLLGGGEITKPLLVSECQISKQANEKIEKAGGKYGVE